MKRIVAVVYLITWLWAAWPAAAADMPTVVELWPGKVPDETGTIGPESVRMSPKHTRNEVEVTEPTRLVTNVSKPTLTLCRPAKETDTGAAILICPGGDYWNLYWELEGEEVAAWLSAQGMTGIILKYRCPRRPGDVKGEPPLGPQLDAQRAVGVSGRASDFADRSNLAVFSWTRGCGRCPMRAQESPARSRTTRSTLIWEIPVNKKLERSQKLLVSAK
jgi:hypothetical protein